ncbi:MAG: DNA mismatch endonuclease Vsr [Phyllobacteriaceae bacterium]|nr:DNA mismatch endonuclease Vsr [Phyllobacteriaceae bacterium]
MTDTRTPAQRRRIMQAVKSADTGPEIAVRRLLFSRGYRYRLHYGRLPGKPDIVFPARRKAIFIHGCFWHRHNCPKGRLPKSRLDYWIPKLEANTERDRRKIAEIEALGWTVLVVWQCEMADVERLIRKLVAFVDGS